MDYIAVAAPPITLSTVPPNATLSVGEETLGAAPQPIIRPEGAATVVVTAVLKGYEPLEFTVSSTTPSQALELVKVKKKPARDTKRGPRKGRKPREGTGLIQ